MYEQLLTQRRLDTARVLPVAASLRQRRLRSGT